MISRLLQPRINILRSCWLILHIRSTVTAVLRMQGREGIFGWALSNRISIISAGLHLQSNNKVMRGRSNIYTNQSQTHRKSNISFIKAPNQSSIHMAEQLGDILTDQFFLKGLQKSYIGQISGNKQQINEIFYDDLLPAIVQAPDNPETTQLNPSTLRRVSAQKALNTDQSMYIADERQEKPLQLQNKELFTLKSLSGADKVQLFAQASCNFCSQQATNNQVKLLVLNQSLIQIYHLASQAALSESDSQLVFTLNFDTVSAQIQISDYSNSTELSIVVGEYRLLLEHASRDATVYWFKRLSAMREKSKGNEFNLTRLIQMEGFYLRRYESEDYFVENCQTGDIILFQDDHFYAKVQRFITSSDFDHVAMVIKDVNFGLLLFESNSGSGVSLTPWRSLIRYKWYESIPRITWRKLELQRDNTFNHCIEDFVKQNLEKNYHISFQKLISVHSYIRSSSKTNKETKQDTTREDNREEEDKVEDHGYFCSELVATIYKELGLLTRDTSSPNYQPACKFYPKDFSDKGNRKLDRGSLSHEYDIFFDEDVLKQKYIF